MPGNTVPAVFAIPAANRPGFTGYFIPTPPSSYRSQAWMSYAGENELPSQWADSVRPLLIPHNVTCLTHFREQRGEGLRRVCYLTPPSTNPLANVSRLKGDVVRGVVLGQRNLRPARFYIFLNQGNV